jgi:hypothetical protein
MAPNLWISEGMLANRFWHALGNSVYQAEAVRDAEIISEKTAPLVDKFPSIAGSISLKSAALVWLTTKYFSPSVICEVGTYIGRSTLSMAFGAAGKLTDLFTCDGSFDCMNFDELKSSHFSDEKMEAIKKIHYYGNTMSHDMFAQIAKLNKKVDLIFVDGRISEKDVSYIKQIASPECVFLIDDFEGVEKGVVNAMILRNNFPNYIILEPLTDINGQKEVLAVMIPSQVIKLSRQQALPVNM